MKYALKFAIPKNDLTSAMVVGLVMLSKAAVRSWVGTTPCSICGMLKMRF